MVPLAFLVAALLAYLPGSTLNTFGPRTRRDPAWSAKEMLSDGQWAIPRFGGRLYVEKPPMFPWLVVLASPRGVSEWTLRLPSVLAAAITLVVTYLLGRDSPALPRARWQPACSLPATRSSSGPGSGGER